MVDTLRRFMGKDREQPGIPGRCDKIVFRLPFLVSKVKQAYIGKQDCACGCGGKYYYKNISDAEDWQLFSTDQKKHSRGIRFAYNKVKRLGAKQGIEVIDNYIYSVELPNRAYRLYLKL